MTFSFRGGCPWAATTAVWRWPWLHNPSKKMRAARFPEVWIEKGRKKIKERKINTIPWHLGPLEEKKAFSCCLWIRSLYPLKSCRSRHSCVPTLLAERQSKVVTAGPSTHLRQSISMEGVGHTCGEGSKQSVHREENGYRPFRKLREEESALLWGSPSQPAWCDSTG